MTLVDFWARALALAILLHVLLDGFDLGVGMRFPFAPAEAGQRQMLAAISPIWDGKETWLVIAAAILSGAFPLVQALLLSAFCLPLLVMLTGLILRGVAFEFRDKTQRLSPRWRCPSCPISAPSRSPSPRRRRRTARCASCSGAPGCSCCRRRLPRPAWSISSSAAGCGWKAGRPEVGPLAARLVRA